MLTEEELTYEEVLDYLQKMSDASDGKNPLTFRMANDLIHKIERLREIEDLFYRRYKS